MIFLILNSLCKPFNNLSHPLKYLVTSTLQVMAAQVTFLFIGKYNRLCVLCTRTCVCAGCQNRESVKAGIDWTNSFSEATSALYDWMLQPLAKNSGRYTRDVRCIKNNMNGVGGYWLQEKRGVCEGGVKKQNKVRAEWDHKPTQPLENELGERDGGERTSTESG